MNEKNFNTYLYFSRLIPQKEKKYTLGIIKKLSEEQIDKISVVKTYDPLLVFLCSVFFNIFAVDRFMIGDIGFGLCKLLLWVIPISISRLLLLWRLAVPSINFWIISLAGPIISLIWAILDIYYCRKAAKEKNLQNILDVLSE